MRNGQKRMAAVLLAPAMVLTSLPLTALSAFAETSGDFYACCARKNALL